MSSVVREALLALGADGSGHYVYNEATVVRRCDRLICHLKETNVVDKLMVTLTSDDLIVKKLSLVALDCLLQCLRGNKESKAMKVIDKIKVHKKALYGIVDLLPIFCRENDQSGVETVLILLQTLLDLNILLSKDFVGEK